MFITLYHLVIMFHLMQLRKETRTELPLWLAKALTDRHITSMDAPAVYGEW